MYILNYGFLLSLVLIFSCGHSDSFTENENELITRVILSFTPENGGDSLVFKFDDPDGDGGEQPRVDSIELLPGSYRVRVGFENGLENPPEDIGAEVLDEATEHQIFFTGSGVSGPTGGTQDAPLLHSYGDLDDNGLVIGLVNTMEAKEGMGEAMVTLRYLPAIAGVAIKTKEIANEVKEGGFSSIGGASDAQVLFPVSVGAATP